MSVIRTYLNSLYLATYFVTITGYYMKGVGAPNLKKGYCKQTINRFSDQHRYSEKAMHPPEMEDFHYSFLADISQTLWGY